VPGVTNALGHNPPAATSGSTLVRVGALLYRLRWALLSAALVRFGYLLAVASNAPKGDELYYSALGAHLAGGGGFTDPFSTMGAQTAEHPPVASLLSAIGALVVPDSWQLGGQPAFIAAQRAVMALVGCLGVVAAAVLGQRLAAVVATNRTTHDIRTAGVWAAWVVTLTPTLWINDALLMAESATALATLAALATVVRAARTKGVAGWVAAGAWVGVGALCRSELVLLVPLVVFPAILLARSGSIASTLLHCGVAAGATMLVCATWVAPNLVRFEEPVLFATNDGLTLVGANCPDTYGGESWGLWRPDCLRHFDSDGNGVDDLTDRLQRQSNGPDASELSGNYTGSAVRFMRDHPLELARTVVVRVARTWGLYRPQQMAEIGQGEGRPVGVSWLAWFSHLILSSIAVAAWWRQRRHREIAPVLGVAAMVTLVSIGAYGLSRFRVPWDAVAAVLAAPHLARATRGLRGRRSWAQGRARAATNDQHLAHSAP
jgi:4-amino-4-deoxy-L-arabinose transferase-like glycosyltransferase